jgi:hypothetical protein
MLSGKALVLTLQGPRFVADLASEGATFVYTWDGIKVTVGEIEVLPSKLVIAQAITLDDDETLYVSKGTSVLLRSGDPVTADVLSAGMSLLPLYVKLDSSGYLIYQEPGKWHRGAKTTRDSYAWRKVSRMVAEWKMRRRCEPGDVVSFRNKVRTDCHPNNLKIDKKTPKRPKKKVEFAEPIFEAQRFINRNNHQVARVRVDTSRDLFSIRGPESANLAVNGIFVSVDTE